jgi:hypothetical protein
MNTAGFSAAALTQKDAPAPSILQQQQQQQQAGKHKRSLRLFTAPITISSSSSSSSTEDSKKEAASKINLVYTDLIPLLLGNFKRVAEAVAEVTPEKFTLVSTNLVVNLEQAIMGGSRDAPVLHTVIHDAEVGFRVWGL